MSSAPVDLQHDPVLESVPTIEGYKTLGPCVLYSRLGAGGMGSVYRGQHLKLDVDVAVKVLRRELSQTSEFIKRFQREARVAARLNDPHLVRVFDVDNEGDLHYVIMEHIEGENGHERVARKGPLAESEALEIIYGAARGLAAAHRGKVLHRDIKPENVLIDVHGVVKLADLGLAKAADDSQTQQSQFVTTVGSVGGTPAYMSPEQCRDLSSAGAASDVFSLGATLYYLLVGKAPFEGDSVFSTMMKICSEDIPDLSGSPLGISEPTCDLLRRMTRRDPQERIEDGVALLEALDAIHRGSPERLADQEAGQLRDQAKVSRPPDADTVAKIRRQTGLGYSPTGTTIVRPEEIEKQPAETETVEEETVPPKPGWISWVVGGAMIVGAIVAAVFLFQGDDSDVNGPGEVVDRPDDSEKDPTGVEPGDDEPDPEVKPRGGDDEKTPRGGDEPGDDPSSTPDPGAAERLARDRQAGQLFAEGEVADRQGNHAKARERFVEALGVAVSDHWKDIIPPKIKAIDEVLDFERLFEEAAGASAREALQILERLADHPGKSAVASEYQPKIAELRKSSQRRYDYEVKLAAIQKSESPEVGLAFLAETEAMPLTDAEREEVVALRADLEERKRAEEFSAALAAVGGVEDLEPRIAAAEQLLSQAVQDGEKTEVENLLQGLHQRRDFDASRENALAITDDRQRYDALLETAELAPDEDARVGLDEIVEGLRTALTQRFEAALESASSMLEEDLAKASAFLDQAAIVALTEDDQRRLEDTRAAVESKRVELLASRATQKVLELGGGVTLRLIWIGPGKGPIGSPMGEPDRDKREPVQSEVTISEGYYLSEFEVSREQWDRVMGTSTPAEKAKLPKVAITIDEARAFCEKLNEEHTGKLRRYQLEGRFRLPTNVEWEYAVRAGKRGPYLWSQPDQAHRYANLFDPAYEQYMKTYQKSSLPAVFPGNDGFALLAPCERGEFRPNRRDGLYHTLGNAWEWVEDGDKACYLRGGAGNTAQDEDCRLAKRRRIYDRAEKDEWWGFRVLLEVTN